MSDTPTRPRGRPRGPGKPLAEKIARRLDIAMHRKLEAFLAGEGDLTAADMGAIVKRLRELARLGVDVSGGSSKRRGAPSTADLVRQAAERINPPAPVTPEPDPDEAFDRLTRTEPGRACR